MFQQEERLCNYKISENAYNLCHFDSFNTMEEGLNLKFISDEIIYFFPRIIFFSKSMNYAFYSFNVAVNN